MEKISFKEIVILLKDEAKYFMTCDLLYFNIVLTF